MGKTSRTSRRMGCNGGLALLAIFAGRFAPRSVRRKPFENFFLRRTQVALNPGLADLESLARDWTVLGD